MHLLAFLSHHIDHPKEEFHVCLLLSTRRSVCGVSFGTVPLDNGWGFIGLFKDTLSPFRKKGNKPVSLESTLSILFHGFAVSQHRGSSVSPQNSDQMEASDHIFFSLGKTEWLLSLVNFLAIQYESMGIIFWTLFF